MAGEWNLAEFKLEDLLQMAVLVEQKGYDFYSAVIEKSPERRVKNEIRFLREEEARHKVLFQEMLKKKGKSASGRLSAALDALLRREFTDPLEELISSKKIESNAEALKFGVSMEQKIVDFYAVLKDLPGRLPAGSRPGNGNRGGPGPREQAQRNAFVLAGGARRASCPAGAGKAARALPVRECARTRSARKPYPSGSS